MGVIMKINLCKIAFSFILAAVTSLSAAEVAETVVTFDKIRPANMAISQDGRMFVTAHPLVNPEIKVVEVSATGTKNVYPNRDYSDSTGGKDSVIKGTIGIRVDSQENLWILDLGAKQFVVWDIQKNKLHKKIKIPENVLTPNSLLQDFALDEKRGRVIIADMTQGDLKSAPTPAFVVVDMQTGKSMRVAENHPSMMPEAKGGFALNPIAIDPGFEWIYFGAISGRKIYRVPAASFDNPEMVAKTIEYYAPKSFSDGIKVDKNHNVYVTDIEKHAIGVSNKDGYKIIATLPKAQSWPDGVEIANDGYLYGVVNQLNRIPALNNGKDDTEGGFLIIRTKLYE